MAVVALPGRGHQGLWCLDVARRAWEAAGSPPVVSAGRFYGEQKRLFDGWDRRLPGFSPAWDPDDPRKPLEHLRGIAFDIANRRDRQAMLNAGFLATEPSEWWHFALPGWRDYPKITSLPASLDSTEIPPAPPQIRSLPMFNLVEGVDSKLVFVVGQTGKREGVQSARDLDSLKRFQEGMLTGKMPAFYFGDLLKIEFYLSKVNG